MSDESNKTSGANVADTNGATPEASSPSNLFELIAQNPQLDLDKYRVKILFLAKSKQGMESTANYLNRRGWETVVTNKIKEAFKIVTTFKPDFFLVSVNVPHPKIEMLPLLITQSFKIPTVIFGESGDTLTLKLMHSTQASFKLHGQASGPNAHRRIKQILQDSLKANCVSTETAVVDQSVEGDSIVIAGKGSSRTSDVLRFSSDDAANSMVSGYGSTSGNTHFSSDHASGADMIGLSGMPSGKSNFQINEGHGTKQESQTLTPSQQITPNISTTDHPKKQEYRLTHNSEHASRATATKEEQPTFTTHFSSDPSFASAQPIEKISREILTEFVNEKSDLFASNLNGASKEASIITLTDGHQEGYLLLFHSSGHEVLKVLSDDFVSRIPQKSAEFNLTLSVLDVLFTDLPFADMEKNIPEESFALKMKYSKGRIGAKYVMAQGAMPFAINVEGHDKLKIDVEDLSIGRPAGVDVFIHLPVNQRYFKILSDRATLSEKIKMKIVEFNINLFINKESRDRYISSQNRNRVITLISPPPLKKKKVA